MARCLPPPHTVWGNFYVIGVWAQVRLPSIYFQATDDIPAGPARDRLGDAQANWFSVDGTTTKFNYIYISTIASGVDLGDCPSSSSSFEGYVDLANVGASDVKGVTGVCKNSNGDIRMFGTAYNSSVTDWYYGTGDAPNGDTDYWGILTHELGHGTGWYTHYIDINDVPPGYPETFCDKTVNDYHTMCKFYWSSNSNYPNRGEWWRTLETHDVDAFESKY